MRASKQRPVSPQAILEATSPLSSRRSQLRVFFGLTLRAGSCRAFEDGMRRLFRLRRAVLAARAHWYPGRDLSESRKLGYKFLPLIMDLPPGESSERVGWKQESGSCLQFFHSPPDVSWEKAEKPLANRSGMARASVEEGAGTDGPAWNRPSIVCCNAAQPWRHEGCGDLVTSLIMRGTFDFKFYIDFVLMTKGRR
jgi:hypothetical protein